MVTHINSVFTFTQRFKPQIHFLMLSGAENAAPGPAPDNPLPQRAGDPLSHGTQLIWDTERSHNSSKRVLDCDYCTELQAA